MKLPFCNTSFYFFTRKPFFFFLALLLLLQASLIFPLWKLPHWRLQAFFGEVWQGRYWPWIPYSLYDQPLPQEGSQKQKLSLWIEPTFLKSQKINPATIGRKITRFQLESLIDTLLSKSLDSKDVSELRSYLEAKTGFSISSCGIKKEVWIFKSARWQKESDEKIKLLW